MNDDLMFMEVAYKEALKAYNKNEVPVGAVIVKDGKIISKAHNLKEKKKDASAHAEVLAIRKASKKIRNWRLLGCTLYVTLEPCLMCSSLIEQSRISRVIFGLKDIKQGSIISGVKLSESNPNFPSYSCGLLENKIKDLLQDFFKNKRLKAKLK